MNKKALQVFGEFFLKTIIVILGLGIVAFVIFFMVQKFGDKKPASTSETASITTEALPTSETASDITSEEPVTEEPATQEAISSVGHSIEVLNSTEVSGVAAGWKDKLTNAGFNVVSIGNYETETLPNTKIIVPQEGMGTDLLEYFPTATIEVGSASNAEIEIIVGTADAQ